jgi:CDP-diacylglycerol--serine O-phosphatidyltransferase
LRLARFNSQAGIVDKRYFQGLASPAAAGTLVFTIWFFIDNDVAGETVSWLIFIETILLGILMFSRVRYYSFKVGPSGDKVPAVWVLLAVLIIVLLALDPPIMGMLFGSAYVFSGLLITVAGRRNWKLKRGQRPAKKQREEPVIGEGLPRDDNSADKRDRYEAGKPYDE